MRSDDSAAPKKSAKELKQDTKLVHLLRNAVEAASDESGWAELGAVGNNVAKLAPEFDPRNWGYAKLSGLLIATKLFDVEERTAGEGKPKTIYRRMVRLMRLRCESISNTFTFTMSPASPTSRGSFTNLSVSIEICTKPS